MTTVKIYVNWILICWCEVKWNELFCEAFQLYEWICADIIEQEIDMEDEFVFFLVTLIIQVHVSALSIWGFTTPLVAMKVAGNTALPDLNTPWDATKKILGH